MSPVPPGGVPVMPLGGVPPPPPPPPPPAGRLDQLVTLAKVYSWFRAVLCSSVRVAAKASAKATTSPLPAVTSAVDRVPDAAAAALESAAPEDEPAEVVKEDEPAEVVEEDEPAVAAADVEAAVSVPPAQLVKVKVATTATTAVDGQRNARLRTRPKGVSVMHGASRDALMTTRCRLCGCYAGFSQRTATT